MMLRLHRPDSFELVHIVLPVEDRVLQAEMRISAYLLSKILPHSLIVEIQFFAAVADCSEIPA